MNCLLLLPDELIDPTSAVMRGVRAAYAIERHDLTEGVEISAALLGKGLGRASVIKISARGEHVELKLSVTIDRPAPARRAIELIVAVPRPQTVKKILQLASTSGLEAVHFIRSEGIEKSYLQSHALMPEQIEEELFLGLEQACDAVAPLVRVHALFKPFIEDFLSAHMNERRSLGFIAHTRTEPTSTLPASIEPGTRTFLAIGPESGWNDFEVASFQKLGFLPLSLGERMLRVETAATMLVGQIGLICPLQN